MMTTTQTNNSNNNNNNTLKRGTKGIKRRNERNILTFYEKIAVIRYYDETNISRNSLAKMFHCCATQIRRILERKEELQQQLATLSEADASIIIEEMTRKRRKFEMSAISFILHKWVERCRQLRLRKSITNQTLKDTALKMAAVLNVPSFRPSYRWLNRFRGKYRYTDEDLGNREYNTVIGELSVEDIIIEFKDSLPSFMQKEISFITSSAKMTEKLTTALTEEKRMDLPIVIPDDNSCEAYSSNSEDDAAAETETKEIPNSNNSSLDSLPSVTNVPLNPVISQDEDVLLDLRVNAGTTAVLNSVFPHLAVIHQFALLNSDVKALELISQLGVHMQTQAAGGVYKQLSLAATNNGDAASGHDGSNTSVDGTGSIYGDIDDIVLIE